MLTSASYSYYVLEPVSLASATADAWSLSELLFSFRYSLYLLYQYNSKASTKASANADAGLSRSCSSRSGTHFTCFTSTKLVPKCKY